MHAPVHLSAKRHVPTMHERMSKSKMALLAVASILYGFFFGIMLAHYWQLGEAALYAVFGLVSAGMLVALSLVKGRVDLTQVIRVCAIAIAVLLTVCALVYEFTTVPLSLVEAAAWAIAIFFTIVVFADSEFLQPALRWHRTACPCALLRWASLWRAWFCPYIAASLWPTSHCLLPPWGSSCCCLRCFCLIADPG